MVFTGALALVTALFSVSGPGDPGGPVWRWPLRPVPEILRPFDPPAHPWEAGHRGTDLAARPGQTVYAAGPGRVGFAHDLAGRGVVTVIHGRLRTTYLPVRPSVRAGQEVAAGARIGVVEDVLGHCGPSACLHWGLRQGVAYFDPLTLLGRGPVRLLPWWPGDSPGRPGGAGDDGTFSPTAPTDGSVRSPDPPGPLALDRRDALDPPGTLTYDQPDALADDPPGTLTHDRSDTLTYDPPGPVTYDPPGSLAHEQSDALTHDPPDTPAYEQSGYLELGVPDGLRQPPGSTRATGTSTGTSSDAGTGATRTPWASLPGGSRLESASAGDSPVARSALLADALAALTVAVFQAQRSAPQRRPQPPRPSYPQNVIPLPRTVTVRQIRRRR